MHFPVIALTSTLCSLRERIKSTHPASLVSCSIPAPSVWYIAEYSGNTYRTSGSQVLLHSLYLSLHSISQLQWVSVELMTVVSAHSKSLIPLHWKSWGYLLSFPTFIQKWFCPHPFLTQICMFDAPIWRPETWECRGEFIRCKASLVHSCPTQHISQ